MTSKSAITIATSSAPVRESLTAWCAANDITVSESADVWLIDGHHPPTGAVPKTAKLLVLGHIPADIRPTHTIPAPATLEDIKTALATYLQPSTISLRKGWSFDHHQRTLTHASEKPVSLTEKEAALLQALLRILPEEINRDALLKEIWAYDKDVDTHTVETHIYRLRQKAGPDAFDIVTTEQGYKVVL